MTEKLYYTDQYLKEFEGTVTSCEKTEDGKYHTILDRTAFFPEGGGQDADSGTLNNVEIEYVFEKGDDVCHVSSTPFEIGEKVKGIIDFKKRFLIMQKHSGEHIFCGVAHSLYGVENMGFHIGSECITVDFDKLLTPEEIKNTEEITNRIIWENREITSSFPTHEEAENIEFRSKKEITGQIRLVTIEGCDVCACCGTHVKNTGEIGSLKITSIAKKRSGTSVTMQVGEDAYKDYASKHDELARLSNMLALKPLEIADGVQRLKDEIASLKYELAKVKLEAFAEKVKELSGPLAVVFEKDLMPDEVRKMCDLLADKVTVAAVLSGSDETGYKYTLASRTMDLRQLAKDFNTALSGRGGGKPEMVQGNVSAKQNEIEDFLRSALQ
ncbi:MAG: hypothetical protein IKL16_01205 [Clostridia bacterium]|nr:hypothetical protein [Clostridia bacterium]